MKRILLACMLLMAAAPSTKRLEKTLPNGVRLIVQKRGSVPWCALTTVLPGGSHKDPDGRSGLAHLAEHLMFEGGDGTNLDERAEMLGMRSNAFTLTDYTIVVEEFSPAVLGEAIEIHASRMRPPTFTDEQLAREKRVVADERRFRVEEPPLGRAEEQGFAALWGGHAWGRPVLGWQEDVDRSTREDILRWTQLRVRPEHAVVALVGAVDAEAAMAKLEAVFSTWKAPPALDEPAREPPAQKDAKKVRLDVNSVSDAIMWMAPAAALGTPEEAADDVLAGLLDVDPGRRVMQLDEDVPPVDFQVEYRPQAHVGEMLLTVLPHGLTDLDGTEKIITHYLTVFSDEGPDPDALDAVRARLIADRAREYELHAAFSEKLALHAALLGSADADEKRLDALRAVTVDDVKARARALLQQPRRVVVRVHGVAR